MMLKEQAVLVTALTFAKNTKSKAKIIILITTICITSNDYIGFVYSRGVKNQVGLEGFYLFSSPSENLFPSKHCAS